ncbi:MFS transporter [Streptomyces albireticuli]|uniref:MFS transporter n=1 Tax=Streptomyces albireticuli TaxID=1940 RepID=A0A2A2DEV5_9ACTN|nr:MFS transporter [Streptomyces albireticuli]MCD9141131.1 MFS transporter [Streptomyces albireticuli]MCD9160908.1 MFS transporter [Streptomyces albireticuli]MCD9191035.1 MFS transporter [Streptomyces albireticuli]PAU49977.1 MFS transporter [Streptomyces albireticuli]
MTAPQSAHGRLALTVCCLAVLMVGLDSTALNVALPVMRRELDASIAGLQWVVDAYNLVVAALMLLAGSVGDRTGRRRTLRAGVAAFVAGSALCGLAPGLDTLIGSRVVQALGGAVIAPVSLSVITHTFPDRAERSRAIGMWSGTFGIGLAVGPLVGGVLVAAEGWRSIFWINVPVGLAVLALSARHLPESRTPAPRRTDPLGQFLVIALLGCLTYAVIDAPHRGWASPVVLGCLAVAAASLTTLIPYEHRRRDPLIELGFFRSVPFTGSVVVSLAAFAALGGFLFLSTLYLQDVRGLSALSAGLWMLPMPVATVLLAPVAGRLVARHGPRLPLVLAGLATVLSGLSFAVLHAGSSVALLLLAYGLFGAGVGLVDVPATGLAVAGMPRARAGVASAISTASCRVGVSVGVAVMGAVLSAGLGRTPGTGDAAVFADATRPAWWIVTGCGAVVAILGVLVTGPRARGTAREASAGEAPVEEPQATEAPAGPRGTRSRTAPGAPGGIPGNSLPKASRRAGIETLHGVEENFLPPRDV